MSGHDSHRIRKVEMRLMELEDEFKEFQKELVAELPPSNGAPLTDTDIHDMGCEIERQAALIAELEAQLGVTESTDSQKEHFRAGIRAWLAGDPAEHRNTPDNGGGYCKHDVLLICACDECVGVYLRNLLNTEPKGTQ